MKKIIRIFGLFISLLFLGACSGSSDYQVTLVYSGNLNGELEPCGCAEETDLGGILRTATVIKEIRTEYPDMILLSTGGVFSSNNWQDEVKAEYILQALKLMAYDAVGLQWKDMDFGGEFISSSGLTWVDSGGTLDEFALSATFQNKGNPVGYFNFLDPDGDPAGNHEHAFDGENALGDRLRAAKMDGQITVLSATRNMEDLLPYVDFDFVDILMLPSADEEFADPELVGGTLVLKYGKRGIRIAALNLEVDENNRIAGYTHEVYKLSKSVADAPELREWYQAYNYEVKATYYANAELRQEMESGQSDYVGSERCAFCHAAETAIWQGSMHAKAFDVLKRVNKDYDPSCIGCHTVGFQRQGGFIEASITPQLLDVQCESCHGPGKDHVNSPVQVSTAFSNMESGTKCMQCHVGDHSPTFSFEPYWQRIQHGSLPPRASTDEVVK